MKNSKYKLLVITLYVLSLFILLFLIKVKLIISIKLILFVLVYLLIYVNGYILAKRLNCNRKILDINLIIYFVIYTIIVFKLTLFDEIFGRQGLIIIDWDKKLIDLYLKYSFNIIPFKTIKLFVNGYLNGIVSLKAFSINVLGNLFAFMPYGLLLPLIFNKMNKFINFLLTMVIIVVIIELLQFITMSGSCDIDDLILNVLGSSIIYFIFKIECISKLINKIFLYE